MMEPPRRSSPPAFLSGLPSAGDGIRRRRRKSVCRRFGVRSLPAALASMDGRRSEDLARMAPRGVSSHCGGTSVRELDDGVPSRLAALGSSSTPRCRAEWGACVELTRGNDPESPIAESHDVAEVIEAVMGDTAMRRRVLEVREVMRKAWAEDGGSSRTALGEFFTSMNLVLRTGDGDGMPHAACILAD
ncbi:hypothetical protein ZWY2020_027866 [Hordeum vulgare]|nr:hypothetical protein ZWY2020_027866 [Hordeum vulgare]